MRHFLKVLPVVFLLQPAFAEDAVWGGSAELGSVWTTGNTKTTSINGQVDAQRDGEVWDTKIKLSALGSSEEDENGVSVTSKEKYTGLLQLNRDYTERSYVAIVGQQDRDRFSGFKYQGTVSAGYGYHAIAKDNMTLDLEAGPGYSRERERVTGEIYEEAIARLVANFSWTIREGVEFYEEFSAIVGDDNQIYRSETGLKSQINGSLATKITYKTKHVAEVPVGSKKTDGEFGVTLVYSF